MALPQICFLLVGHSTLNGVIFVVDLDERDVESRIGEKDDPHKIL